MKKIIQPYTVAGIENKKADVLQVEGIGSKGFGTIPKLVMQDRRLTVQAKAIYGYFASYAGAGQTAFPSRQKITADLRIGNKSYYRHFNLLKQYGYVTAKQERFNGKFVRNIYTLPESVPCALIDHPEPCTFSAHTLEAHAQKNYSNINSIKNKQVLNNNSLSCLSATEDGTDKDIAQRISQYTETVKANIGYQDFETCHPYDLRLADELIAIIVDTLVSDSSHVAIDGENKPRGLVQHQLMKLDYETVEHVVEQFKALSKRVNKKRQYLLSMLYNAGLEIDAHYTNLVNSDHHK